MASIVELNRYPTEPIDLATAKQFLRLPADPGPDDTLIQTIIIPGARAQLESFLGLTLANRDFVQYEDGFPFFPYFQSPYAPLFGAAFPFYFGYGPIASYPYPAIGGLQNQILSPFEKKLLRSPVTAASRIVYIGTDGKQHGLQPGKDFSVDFSSTPGRITPLPGQRWPVGVLGNNTVAIYFSAGYLPPNSPDEDVAVGAIWQALYPYAQNRYILDSSGNLQLQTALKATTGRDEPIWTKNVGDVTSDGSASWTNLGSISPNKWQANATYSQPLVIRDSKGNLQLLNVSSFTSGGTEPNWKTNFNQSTDDGSTTGAWLNIGKDLSQGATDPSNQIAEYIADVSIPQNLYVGLLQLIVHWYQQRSVIVTQAGAGGTHIPLPLQLMDIIQSERILDFSRGK